MALLDMELVETLMRRHFPTVSRDRDGDLEAKVDSPGGYQVTMWVRAAGRTSSTLECLAESRKHQASRSRWAEAVWVCNQWNLQHYFPRVSLYIPDFAQVVRAPVQCRTLLELTYGEWDVEFMDAQLSHAANHAVGFYQWLDEDPDLAALFTGIDEERERQHARRMAAVGRTIGATTFAEEFFVDEGYPRIREREGFAW